MDRTCNVTLRYVRNLMRDDASQLVLVSCCLDQAGVHTDVAPGQGEGVDARLIDNKKGELVIAIVGVSGDPVADVGDVFVDLGVFDEHAAASNLLHDLAADLRLDGLR